MLWLLAIYSFTGIYVSFNYGKVDQRNSKLHLYFIKENEIWWQIIGL